MAEAAALRVPIVRPGARLVVILGAMAALGPLSFDMYLPAFPQLRETFGASASAVQLTLTCALVGLGLGQLLIGPMSDARGRRAPLLVGLAAYVCASLLCAVAPVDRDPGRAPVRPGLQRQRPASSSRAPSYATSPPASRPRGSSPC